MESDVGVRRMPRGLRQVALSIFIFVADVRPTSRFSRDEGSRHFSLRPERRFWLNLPPKLRRPSLRFGSSSLISLRSNLLSLSGSRLRPGKNIQAPSRFRLRKTRRVRKPPFRGFRSSYEETSVKPTAPLSQSYSVQTHRSACPSKACPLMRILKGLCARTTSAILAGTMWIGFAKGSPADVENKRSALLALSGRLGC